MPRQAQDRARRTPPTDPAAKRPEVRRHVTRDRLLATARELFFTRDYFELSVDYIAKMAGLSRAAFYLHYPSKEAILVDIIREGSARMDSLYRRFEPGERITKAKLREFILLVVRVNRRSSRQLSLFYQAASYNPDIWKTFAANRDRHMDILGEAIPAFRARRRAGLKERHRRAAAHLLLYQLEQLALYATFVEEPDLEAQVEVLADTFAAFIKAADA